MMSHAIVNAVKSFLICIVSIFIFELFVPMPLDTYAEDADVLSVQVIADDKMSLSNGKYIALDISCTEFLEHFNYNDIVTVSVNGHSYDVPVCSTWPNAELSTNSILLNFKDKYLFGKNFDHIYLNSTVRLIEIESGIFKENDSGSDDKYIFNRSTDSPMWAEIKLKKKWIQRFE